MSRGELAPGIDLDAMLLALAKIETSDGRNNWPRVEASYIPSGLAFTVQGRVIKGTGSNVNAIVTARWALWGLPSSASWGPWQILFHTAADLGFSGAPHELMAPKVCEPYVVARLRKIAMTGASAVRDFADAWNSGSWRDANLVPAYTEALEDAYKGLPS